jgi:hypothetical protein
MRGEGGRGEENPQIMLIRAQTCNLDGDAEELIVLRERRNPMYVAQRAMGIQNSCFVAGPGTIDPLDACRAGWQRRRKPEQQKEEAPRASWG